MRIVGILGIILLTSLTLKSDFEQTGRASYYANKFHGRRTSSGEVFNQNLMTAAHKTLPFGTLVEVKNIANDSIVVVKVNDRLSKSSPSIIDLSLKAAQKLNFVRNGHAKVQLKSLQ